MQKILSWNLDEQTALHPETRGWFLGPYMKKFPELQTEKVELKWIRYEKWYIKPGLSSKKHLKTICILFSWKVRVDFDTKESILLQDTGDFVFFDTNYSDHTTYILEDCVMIAIRWKEE